MWLLALLADVWVVFNTVPDVFEVCEVLLRRDEAIARSLQQIEIASQLSYDLSLSVCLMRFQISRFANTYFSSHLVHGACLFLARLHWKRLQMGREKIALNIVKWFKLRQLQRQDVSFFADLAHQIKRLVFAHEPDLEIENIVLNLLNAQQVKTLRDPSHQHAPNVERED